MHRGSPGSRDFSEPVQPDGGPVPLSPDDGEFLGDVHLKCPQGLARRVLDAVEASSQGDLLLPVDEPGVGGVGGATTSWGHLPKSSDEGEIRAPAAQEDIQGWRSASNLLTTLGSGQGTSRVRSSGCDGANCCDDADNRELSGL